MQTIGTVVSLFEKVVVHDYMPKSCPEIRQLSRLSCRYESESLIPASYWAKVVSWFLGGEVGISIGSRVVAHVVCIDGHPTWEHRQ